MTAVDKGLYIRIAESGVAFWVFRHSANSKRRQIIIGKFGKPPEGMSLTDARDLVAQKRADVRNGLDPLAEKKPPQFLNCKRLMMLQPIGSPNVKGDSKTRKYLSESIKKK